MPFGGRLRVELAGPWYVTGEGERLGVLGWPGDAPPEAVPYICEAGRDPLWDTPGDGRWFADVELPRVAATSYCPLVRLAVTRYQPNCAGEIELSRVVKGDVAPLLPDRTLRVQLCAGGRVSVVLEGLEPAGPHPNRVDVVERGDVRDGAAVDLLALEPPPGIPAWEPGVNAGDELGDARVGGTQQLGDDLARLLAAGGGDSLEALGIVTLDADQDPQRRTGISLVALDLPWLGMRDLRIEIAGLGVGICPRILVHLNQ